MLVFAPRVPRALIVLISFAVSGAAFGQDRRIEASKKKRSDATRVSLNAGSGFGIFQDVQVPTNDDAGVRGDGTVIAEELADHTGFPLYAGLGALREGKNWTFEGGVNFLSMRATTGPAATQSSSYARSEISFGAKRRFEIDDDRTFTLGASAAGRRSSFNNVSNGHYVEATLVGANLALTLGDLTLIGKAAYSPTARFGYNDGPIFGGKAFADSTASIFEMGGGVQYRLRGRVFLDAGFEREQAHVTIADIEEYNGLGLGVTTAAVQPSRTYDLATTVVKLGVRKEF